MKNNHNRGNRKAQKKRRIERRKNLPEKQEEKCLLIDGNYSFYPTAYCWKCKAYLTQGLVDTHRCNKRKCKSFEKLE